MELSNLSLAELKNLQQLLPDEIKRREKEEKAKARKHPCALVVEPRNPRYKPKALVVDFIRNCQ